ncbi:Histone H1-like nucleoprotein HC2 [Brevundimonas vesicularis]|uniref:Histone H1-like nucleoprotein HC2 n=1 Tax=Brevundimonas vesicularis TaxID=41276 RepID=A0A2X1DAG3_BREVE|nr:histone H1-like repetitive region-containing protein [Brevundimonas vesicularis]SPU55876.1 Histone H1-like nucleoprotein HC2 [Brevundimonas vesicularis]
MDNTNTPTSTSQLALQAASSQAQPTLDAAAEKAAAEKAAAEKAAAEKAAAEKAAAEKAAAEKAAAEKAAAEKAAAEKAAAEKAAAEKAAAEKAAAEKAAADKAAADKAAADKAAADKAAADKAAADKAAKPPRARRGPPADGGEEERVDAILSTSKLLGAGGERLRRGMAVSVPKRRAFALERSGKIRFGSVEEVERAATRLGSARIG